MTAPLFDALDRDWAIYQQSRSARAARRRWHSDVYLGGRAPGDIVVMLRSHRDVQFREIAARHLLDLAHTDVDARRVALQAVMPPVRNIASRYRHRCETEDDAASLVVAHAVAVIATWNADLTGPPLGSVVRRIEHNVWVRHNSDRRRSIDVVELDDHDPPDVTEPAAAEAVLAAVGSAVLAGLLTPDRARLVLLYRLVGERTAVTAAKQGVQPCTIRKLRHDAEQIVAAVMRASL